MTGRTIPLGASGSTQPLRVGLNLLHALPEIGGGWIYIANVLAALGEFGGENQYVAFVTTESESLVPAKPNFEIVRVDINPHSRLQRVAFENSALQILARRHRLDCMHWFGNVQAVANSVPGVVTVHDLQALRSNNQFGRVKRLYTRWMTKATAKRAPLLLPVSQATADDLARALGVSERRMLVIPIVLEPTFRVRSDEEVAEFRKRRGLPERFWLYVAHVYPHKNHIRLLQALHDLKTRGVASWPLVLRGDDKGSEGDVRRTIEALRLTDDVIWLPPLPREELPLLFAAATAQVFPSLFEGAGLPVLEAMACGCPVTTSRIPAVQEFAGDAACYFDPDDRIDIASAMARYADDPDLRSRMRMEGLERASQFRAQPVIRALLDAYRRVARRD